MLAAAGHGGPVEEFVGWGGGGGGGRDFLAFGGGGGCHGGLAIWMRWSWGGILVDAGLGDGVDVGSSWEEELGSRWQEWSVVWTK